MITTVVFDLDDTLYDEVDYCKSGFDAVGRFIEETCSLPEGVTGGIVSEFLWSQFQSGNRTRTFNSAIEKFNITSNDDFIAELVAIYRNHPPAITLPDESRAILDKLSPKYKLALLSDGFMPAQRLKVESLGIETYFQCIVYTEEMGREFWKPSTAGFERIVKSLAVKPENCVYIADNLKKDFIGPNELGFQTIQLIRPNRIHTSGPLVNKNAAAGHIITSFTQLSNILENL